MRELPLIGREREAEAIVDALEPVLNRGPSRVLVVEGAAGTGKSHLTRHVAREAVEAGRARLFEIHNHPGEEGEGLADLASRLLGRARCPVDGASRAVLREWVDFHTPTPPEADRHRALDDALAALVRERPTVLLVDDLQWGPEARRWTESLVERVPEGLLVLVTERLEPGAPSVLPDAWTRLRVGGLSALHAERLAAEVLGEGTRAIQLAEISRGNPLLAVQLALHFVQTGRFALSSDPSRGWSARLDAVLLMRPALEAPLRLAAVVGGEVPFAEWSALGGGSVEALVRAGLAEELPDRWRLAHPLLVDAVRAMTPDGAWRELSGRAADRLRHADPLRRARLLLAAARDLEAFDVGCAVAEEALEREDLRRAERALELVGRCDTADAARRTRALVCSGHVAVARSDYDDARAVLRALEAARGADVESLRARLAILENRADDAAKHLEVALAERPDDPALLDRLAYVEVRRGRVDAARSLCERAMAVGPTSWQAGRTERRMSHIAAVEGRLADAEDHALRAEAHAEEAGAPGLVELARGVRAELYLLAGRPAEALALLRSTTFMSSPRETVELLVGVALLELGHPVRARAVLAPWRAIPRGREWASSQAIAAVGLARCGLLQGDASGVPDAIAAVPPRRLEAPVPPELARQLRALAAMLDHEPALQAAVQSTLGTRPTAGAPR